MRWPSGPRLQVVDAGLSGMQASYPPVFERDMGCTPAEWLGWLPRALGDYAADPTQLGMVTAADPADTSRLRIRMDEGQLTLAWKPLEPRRLGLAVLPRLWVRFEFVGVDDGVRHRFMKRFDLYTQRGGG
ncbi:MAG: hypothetical protein ACOVO0_01720 [Burkholderiaceae bacterium]|jgi:hypothetical protein